jgi:IgGFc binding protein
MKRRISRPFVVRLGIALAAVGLGIAACSATGEDNDFDATATGQGAGSPAGPGSGPGTGVGGNLTVGSSGVGGACGYGCSADLKKVIDCNGTVISQCTGDQGCANGQCIDNPCEAAEVSKSSYGCDYYSLETDLILDGAGACFAAFVANTWSVPVHINVEYNGQQLPTANFTRIPQGQGQGLQYAPYDAAAGLPVGEVAILFLSRAINGALIDCPVAPAVSIDAAVHGTGRGKAFHITTDRPVVAYQILPYGGGESAATSATLLLPTSAWDTNYIAINAYPKSQIVPAAAPSLDILAKEDGTEVTILPKVAINAGAGVTGGVAGQPVTYLLNRGEYIQFTQDLELTGSPIQSSKPIGVFGGASCLNVPVQAAACDSAHQQIPPVRALGSEYAGVRYRGRLGGQNEAPPWRVVGAVDGTQLTWTPAVPAGAPTQLNLGDVYEFNSTGPFVVASQDKDHPFYAAAYMTGADMFNGEGDPEWVNVIPTAQYLDSYVFFTDPTYSETSLVVVRRPASDGTFADVTLDCAGPLSGWEAIGPYEFTRVDLVTGDFQNVGGCSNGRHEISSDLPFGVTVWGWGGAASSFFTQYVSYAYPAGASVQSINQVVIPPIPD